jgi:hypothetical protein
MSQRERRGAEKTDRRRVCHVLVAGRSQYRCGSPADAHRPALVEPHAPRESSSAAFSSRHGSRSASVVSPLTTDCATAVSLTLWLRA